MSREKICVIGAGIGGLAAAVDLARGGADVTVLDRAAGPGGKMRQVNVDGAGIDAGPTVFTMRWIFESLFADSGARLDDSLVLQPLDILARHAWRAGGRLDLFADLDRSADAIGAFAGPENARGYRDFCARAQKIYQTLAGPFIASERPSMLDLVRRVGLNRLDELWRTAPMRTMWGALGDHFSDPRLRQSFGRYATYTGCSPMLAPATLMLVAHVEQDGVWQVGGGMRQVAEAIRSLVERNGGKFRFNADVREITVRNGRASGVILTDGERIDADAIVFNGDVSALGKALLGRAASHAAPATPPQARSLSAITWCVRAQTSGFPLAHHNVFFAEDYAEEFDAIFRRRRIAEAPTVYVCAQDRGQGKAVVPGDPERMLVLINAPPDGNSSFNTQSDLQDLEARAFGLMQACGLRVDRTSDTKIVTMPSRFAQLFPGTGGALYGRAGHGAMGSFQRPGSVSRLPCLYLAGGSVHPGPGIPMAAMSGRLAAARLLQDWATVRGGSPRPVAFAVPRPAPA